MKRYNEKELIKFSKEHVYFLNGLTDDKGIINDDVTDKMPCWIHINKMSDLSPTYFNKTALNNFNESLENIKNEGLEFLYRIIHPETVKTVVPLKLNFIKTGDTAHVLFFEQKIRYSISDQYKNHLCFSVINNKLASTLTATFPANFLEEFVKRRIFNNTNIFERFYEGFINLTMREREILKYISEGKSNKKISDQLGISALTVKTHRRNILNKLGTNKITDLTRIAVYFNLVEC